MVCCYALLFFWGGLMKKHIFSAPDPPPQAQIIRRVRHFQGFIISFRNLSGDLRWLRDVLLIISSFEMLAKLVVPTQLKNISQIGSSPQVGMKIQKICWNHHLGLIKSCIPRHSLSFRCRRRSKGGRWGCLASEIPSVSADESTWCWGSKRQYPRCPKSWV